MGNKVVLITGGSSGIGKALAFEYARKGWSVAITGRNMENLQATVAEMEGVGLSALIIQADVSVEEDSVRMADEVVAKYGQIDCLINNAGISMRSLFTDLDLSVIRRLMEVNFFGTVNATKYCLPHIMKAKGSIIGISSIAGFRGLPLRTGYSASKFAMQGFLESLRTELLNDGVHVLIACPGFTTSNIRQTALTATGERQGESPRDESAMMSAEEVATIIYKAHQKKKKVIVMTGKGKLIVFLNKWMNGLMDRLVYNEFEKEEKQ